MSETPTGLNKWQAMLAAEVEGIKSAEATAKQQVDRISVKGGKLHIDDAEVPGNSMEVVILDMVFENQFYSKGYDPKNPATPDCYAFGRDQGNMNPHSAVEAPIHTSCQGCPKSYFGTALVGAGKACKEVRRLALMLASDLADTDTAEVRLLKVAFTSSKGWSSYVRHLTEVLSLPPLAVVTRISVVPEPGNPGWRLAFEYVEPVLEDYMEAVIRKKHNHEERMFAAYAKIEPAGGPSKDRKFGEK